MGTANQAANEAYEQGQDQCEQRDAQGHPETGKDNRKVSIQAFPHPKFEHKVLDVVPGTAGLLKSLSRVGFLIVYRLFLL
jgi:hypothetical protein